MHPINTIKSKKTKKDKYGYMRDVINRLQIPVCTSCHSDINRGIKYSIQNLIELYNLYLAKL